MSAPENVLAVTGEGFAPESGGFAHLTVAGKRYTASDVVRAMRRYSDDAEVNPGKWRIEMRGDERCIVDDSGVVAVVFADDGGAEARAILDALKNRAAVAELIAAIIADEARPSFVTLDYRKQRKDGEPEGPKWWEWRRKHLDAQGYILSCEANNGCEYFVLPAGMSDRTAAALARVQGGAA